MDSDNDFSAIMALFSLEIRTSLTMLPDGPCAFGFGTYRMSISLRVLDEKVGQTSRLIAGSMSESFGSRRTLLRLDKQGKRLKVTETSVAAPFLV